MDRGQNNFEDNNVTSHEKIPVDSTRGTNNDEEPSEADLCICYDCGDYLTTWKLEIVHIPCGSDEDDQENHVTVNYVNSNSCNESGEFGLSQPKLPIDCNLHSGKGSKCIEKHIITRLSRVPIPMSQSGSH